MKTIRKTVGSLFVALLASAASLTIATPAHAQSKLADDYFATGATDAQHAGLWGITNFVIIPTPSEGSGQALITQLSVRSDTAGSGVAFWAPGTNAPIVHTNSVIATNKVWVNATNNFFVDGDHVLIQHKAGTNQPALWEYNIASSFSGFIVTLRSNTSARLEAGDIVWKLNQVGFIQTDKSTNANYTSAGGGGVGFSGPGIFASPRNQPLLLELKTTTTSAAAIDTVSGRYVRQ